MPRKRSPERDLARQLWLESGKKKKLKEIAAELGVQESQVRKWKSQDKWNSNVTETNGNVTKRKTAAKSAVEEGYIREDVEQVLENEDLNEKQKLFCLYYIKSHNATKAYQKAYDVSYETAASAGPRLFGNVRVKEEIQRLKQNKLNREMLDEDDIFQKYIDIAFADITDFVKFGREEVPVMGAFGPVKVEDPATGDKIVLKQMVNTVKFRESADVDGTLISEVKQGRDGASLKLADRMKALQWLSDHMDMASADQKAKMKKFEDIISQIGGEGLEE